MEDWIDHDETIFENKFAYTPALLKELYKGMLKWDKRRRMNMIFIYILLGINIAMNIVFIVIGNYSLFRLLIISLILLAAVAIFRALEPVILSRSIMRSYEKRYNEPMDVYTTFDEDYMTTHDVSLGATAQRAITYDRISSVHESENFIVLRLDKRQVMSILKTGFIKGDLEDFRVFIMRKIHEAEEGYEDVNVDTEDVESGRDDEAYIEEEVSEAASVGEEGFEPEAEEKVAAETASDIESDISSASEGEVSDVGTENYADLADAELPEEDAELDAEPEADPFKASNAFGRSDRK